MSGRGILPGPEPVCGGGVRALQDVRIASVVEQDVRLEQNKMVEFRVKLKVSFKYHKEIGD
jgi:hypothetical protein